jgi:hypothetical protein
MVWEKLDRISMAQSPEEASRLFNEIFELEPE